MGPRIVLAQPSPGRPRRIGLMMAISENDPEGLHRVETFRQSLKEAGWADGQNVAIETAWYRGNFQRAQIAAKDYADRQVDVIVVNGTPGMDAVRALGTSIPVVFVVVSDPVGAGFVSNLSRPGANVTGFSTFEPDDRRQVVATAHAGDTRSEARQYAARSKVHRLQLAVEGVGGNRAAARDFRPSCLRQQPSGDRARA